MTHLSDIPNLPVSAGPTPPGYAEVISIEVVQAIQDLAHTVTLVASKRTVVRVYLNLNDTPTMATGILKAVQPNGTITRVFPLGPVNLDPADNGDLRKKREDEAYSLNFELPAGLTVAGIVRFELESLEDSAGIAKPLVMPTFQRTVEFISSPPLRLRLLTISYRFGNPPATHLPSARDYACIESWLRRAYPVSNVILSRATITVSFRFPFTCNQVNARLTALRAVDMSSGAFNPRTHYYGLVADGGGFMRGCAAVPSTPDPTAVGSGPTGSGSGGWDFDGSYGDWYTGHELGHTFGRKHPGFCGETRDDLRYPFPNGQLSGPDGAFVGFDVGDAALAIPAKALPGVNWHDVMTYCSYQWISHYTYLGIRKRIIDEDVLVSRATSPGMPAATRTLLSAPALVSMDEMNSPVSVVGQVTLRGAPKDEFLYVTPIERAVHFAPPPEALFEGALAGEVEPIVEVGVLSDGGETRYRAQVKRDVCYAEGEAPDEAIFDAVVEAGPDTERLRLYMDGVQVAEYIPGAAPDSQENTLETMLNQPADTSHLRYTTQVAEEDNSWSTVSTGDEQPNLYIHAADYPNQDTVRVRVQATNGLVSTTVFEGDVPLERS